jgi:long-subunit fatty acid transport protein
MKKSIMTAAAIGVGATGAFAGGIERARTDTSILFEDGAHLKFSVSRVSPDISGEYPGGALGTGSTGNMANSYTSLSLGYKRDLNEKLSYALTISQPYGASATYSSGFYTGLQAEWKTNALTALIAYNASDAVTVYGGARVLDSSADIAIPTQLLGGAGNYTATGSTTDVGYILGAAYEKPEIALRVGLTYESAITHDFATSETLGGGDVPSGITSVTMPQTVTLDFQSGVAENTLVFGSIRWAEWTEWSVTPPFYGANISGGAPVVDFSNDTFTYQLGVGRRINENLALFAQASYEKANGGVASRLSPTDGRRSLGIGGSYTVDNITWRGGIEYVEVGDAVDSTFVQFNDNSAIGIGLSVGYSF